MFQTWPELFAGWIMVKIYKQNDTEYLLFLITHLWYIEGVLANARSFTLPFGSDVNSPYRELFDAAKLVKSAVSSIYRYVEKMGVGMETPIYITSDELRKTRERLNLSVRAMAEKLQLAEGTYRHYEYGQRTIPAGIKMLLCLAAKSPVELAVLINELCCKHDWPESMRRELGAEIINLIQEEK